MNKVLKVMDERLTFIARIQCLNRITISSEIVNLLKLKKGDYLEVEIRGIKHEI